MYTYPRGTFPYIIQPYDTLWLLSQKYQTNISSISTLNPGLDVNNLKVGQVVYICPGYNCTPANHYAMPKCISEAELNLSNEMRMLWEQHDVWTRETILSIVHGLPETDLIIKRLLRNPIDFQKALTPFYGEKIASTFGNLLKDHLVIAGEIVTASKAGNTKAAADAEKRWYANADEIAALLSRINPYWSEEEWRKMLYEHLSLVKAEAVTLLTKDYPANIAIYDKIEAQSLGMADMLTQGIVKQFPNQFRP